MKECKRSWSRSTSRIVRRRYVQNPSGSRRCRKTDEAHEGVLHEILGQCSVAGEHEGQAETVGRIGDVELGERPAFDALFSHLARAICSLPHVRETHR